MEITRIFDILPYIKERYNSDCVLSYKEEGAWRKYPIDEIINTVNSVSKAFIALGIEKGDMIGIMSPNRPEWNMVDLGITQIGAVQVPFYPTLSDTDFDYIVKDCSLKILFVANKELAHRVGILIQKSRDNGGNDIKVYTFDKIEGFQNWKDLLDIGEKFEISLDTYRSNVLAEDLLTLIYTSGTTGTPKGVMLTHHNLVSQLYATQSLIPTGTKVALSFLPLSHIFERKVIYLYLYNNVQVYYAESMDTIVVNLNEVHPDIFTTVPRLLEKVYDRIVAKGKELKGLKKVIFFWALNVGLNFESMGDTRFIYHLQLSLARKLVFSKWIEGLGGKVKTIVSGGAALQPRLAKIFTAAGATVLEGYGLTETSPVISVNTVGMGHKIGTVGKVIQGDEVRIAEDGEIIVRGPNIMKGYYKNPEKTKEAIDENGFFHTGDLGELDEEGFLKITGRKKEVFKTSGGKYISPAAIENKLKESPFIEQIMVIGEGERFPAALIVPAFEHLKSWCAIHEITYIDNETMVKLPEVLQKYQTEVDAYTKDFGHWEQIKKFALLPKEWSIDGGEMTPKLSIKRNVVMQKFSSLIQDIYNQDR